MYNIEVLSQAIVMIIIALYFQISSSPRGCITASFNFFQNWVLVLCQCKLGLTTVRTVFPHLVSEKGHLSTDDAAAGDEDSSDDNLDVEDHDAEEKTLKIMRMLMKSKMMPMRMSSKMRMMTSKMMTVFPHLVSGVVHLSTDWAGLLLTCLFSTSSQLHFSSQLLLPRHVSQ